MDTRKYGSPLGRDIGTSKATKGRGWKGLKGQMALALAVSLWIAGGGAAWAEDVDSNTNIKVDHKSEGYNLVKDSDGTAGSGVTFTVEGPNGEVKYITSDKSGNTITVESGGKVTGSSGGAGITGGVNNNQITMAGTVKNRINGGYSVSGEVTGNQITISGSVEDYVQGGNSDSGAAKDNHVTLLADGKVKQSIHGGCGGGDDEKNTVTIKGGEVEYVYGAKSTGGDVLENEVYIQGGTVKYNVYGGSTNWNEKKASGNVVVISDGTVNAVYGGHSSDGQATGNIVTITGGTINVDVHGGESTQGQATGNIVTITGGTIKGNVYGGDSFYSQASGNTVTITGGTINGNSVNVYGGHSESSAATGNTVNLGGASLTTGIYGGYSDIGEDSITGNVLNLYGANSVGGVCNFEKITLDEKLAWNTTKPVLSAGSFSNFGGLDITAATNLTAATTPGTMTLLQGTSGNFNTLNLTYKNGTTTATAALGGTKPTSQVVKTVTGGSSVDKGVTLGYDTTHTVSIADTSKVTYTVANYANKITLGTITWNKNGTARALTAGDYTFNDSTVIDTSSFEFNTPSYIGAGDSMTLLSNATGLTAGDNIAHRQSYTNYDNYIKLNATLTGNITRTTNTLGYTATGTTLDSVDLANWNGTTTAVPAGWGSNLGENSIKAAGFTAPDVVAGESKDILTTTKDNFFNDNQITGALKYKAQATSTDTANGVALTGSESKGVKASNDGKSLVYARSNFNVSNISFGEMTWGTSRDASGTGYDYSNAAVNIDGLTFSNPEAVSDATTTLLKANSTFTQVIPETTKNISYGYSPVDGVTVDGIINGSYKTDSNAIKYTATANNATKLTFGNVEWKDTGALMTRPSNITFTGAAVDTSNIKFTNIKELEANKKMTLVKDFGTAVGMITGSKYKVGSNLLGEGHAFFENSNLLYLVTKGVDGKADASGNTEEITGGKTVKEDVIGAATDSGKAESNKANVSGNSEVTGNVIGAETTSGLLDKNEAIISGNSQINGNVTAGKTESGNAAANITKVENSMVTGNAVGAVTDTGVATGNEVNITGGSVGGDVAGATSDSGTVSQKNQASVVNANVVGNVYGGKSTSGEVNTNIANVSGGTVNGSVYGGMTDGEKKSEGNEVKLESNTKVQKDVYGGYSQQGTATGNKVTIDGAAVDGTIYGGKSKNKSDNNSVELDNGTVGAIVGGGCEEAGGNIVTITGGEVLSGVYGAKAGSSATNNTITMSGGKVNNVLYGGYADSATGITTGNTVTLYGTADVSNAGVFGGNGSDITGNVLNIGTIINDVAHSWSGGGQSVKNVANFETMNFVSVPWNKEKAAVTISDGTASDLSATKVNATTVHFTDTTSLKQGDTMTLLDEQKVAVDKRVQAGNITKESEYTAGSTLKGTGILSMDDSGNVIYKVTDKDSSDQSHNTVMGATASMAALSAGNDFVGAATEGLSMAGNTGTDGMATYANLGGGSMNVETGSHVKTHTWNAILALGHKNEKKLSTTEYGAFFEYGTGNYSTFNGDERGDGSTRYTGGGILGKWKQNNGFYVEGSLRAGSIHDDAHNVLRDGAGNPYSYDTDATYWGAHIGVGREIKLNKTDILDLYAKYFYNHRGSVSFDAGGHYDLGAVESSVLRVGTRYTVKQNDNINYYGGLAVEHEFCGRASGFADGVAIRGADISGTSVRGEIGATFRPGEKSNVTLDLNLSGFAGKKEGLTGGLSAVFHI